MTRSTRAVIALCAVLAILSLVGIWILDTGRYVPH